MHSCGAHSWEAQDSKPGLSVLQMVQKTTSTACVDSTCSIACHRAGANVPDVYNILYLPECTVLGHPVSLIVMVQSVIACADEAP
jgi:hypothetical protein